MQRATRMSMQIVSGRTAGRFPVLTETFLGLRHGPRSFFTSDALVLCLLSSAIPCAVSTRST
jgi:hypothetical protein